MKPSSSSDRASELCWGGCGDARSIQRGLLCHTERTPSLTAQTGINSQEARATLRNAPGARTDVHRVLFFGANARCPSVRAPGELPELLEG